MKRLMTKDHFLDLRDVHLMLIQDLRYIYSSRGASSSAEIISTNQPADRGNHKDIPTTKTEMGKNLIDI